MAFWRAAERLRAPAERIVDDPYARAFLGAARRSGLRALSRRGRAGLVERIDEAVTSGVLGYVLARHRFLDAALRRAAEGGLDQVLVLGAGYDMRAWRHADVLGDVDVFEVDHPATAARKARILAREPIAEAPPGLRLHRVPVDFATQDLGERLASAGFRRDVRTFAVWEGVSMYLSEDAVRRTLSWLAGAGSTVGFDFGSPVSDPGLRGAWHRMLPQALAVLGEPIAFGMPPERAGPFLGECGLGLVELAGPAELAAACPRPVAVYPYAHVAVAAPAA